jgi:hypothetical protein
VNNDGSAGPYSELEYTVTKVKDFLPKGQTDRGLRDADLMVYFSDELWDKGRNKAVYFTQRVVRLKDVVKIT